MKLTLHVWRQKNAQDTGGMVRYDVPNVNEHMSFLEMLDVLNESLIEKGQDPIAFDHDCREGICGMCGNDDQWQGPRAASRAPPSARFTCATSKTAT